jgi:hypothetical protein
MNNIDVAKYINALDGGQPVAIRVTFENSNIEIVVPMDPANSHYAEILRQVAAGTLTIEDAD